MAHPSHIPLGKHHNRTLGEYMYETEAKLNDMLSLKFDDGPEKLLMHRILINFMARVRLECNTLVGKSLTPSEYRRIKKKGQKAWNKTYSRSLRLKKQDNTARKQPYSEHDFVHAVNKEEVRNLVNEIRIAVRDSKANQPKAKPKKGIIRRRARRPRPSVRQATSPRP